jgi:hypothetical protein
VNCTLNVVTARAGKNQVVATQDGHTNCTVSLSPPGLVEKQVVFENWRNEIEEEDDSNCTFSSSPIWLVRKKLIELKGRIKQCCTFSSSSDAGEKQKQVD